MRRAAVRVACGMMLVLSACGGGSEGPSPPAPSSQPVPIIIPPDPPQSDMPRRSVTLLLPSTDASGLRAIPAEIFSTASPVDQAKQIVGLLLAPPHDDTVTRPFPEGTLLRSVFLDGRGTAFVSLSREAVTKAPGGSTWEMLAVSALVGTLQRSMPSIKRVQLLIEGQEIDTLTGHLDLRAPVSLDDRLVTEP